MFGVESYLNFVAAQYVAARSRTYNHVAAGAVYLTVNKRFVTKFFGYLYNRFYNRVLKLDRKSVV